MLGGQMSAPIILRWAKVQVGRCPPFRWWADVRKSLVGKSPGGQMSAIPHELDSPSFVLFALAEKFGQGRELKFEDVM
jgi:hypothetical protein